MGLETQQEMLWKATYVLTFLSQDETYKSRHQKQHGLSVPFQNRPLVKVKNIVLGQ